MGDDIFEVMAAAGGSCARGTQAALEAFFLGRLGPRLSFRLFPGRRGQDAPQLADELAGLFAVEGDHLFVEAVEDDETPPSARHRRSLRGERGRAAASMMADDLGDSSSSVGTLRRVSSL